MVYELTARHCKHSSDGTYSHCNRGHDRRFRRLVGFRKMKWYLPSYWWSLLMGGRTKSEASQPSETSTDATSSQRKLSAVETSVGLQVTSTTTEKQTPGASRSSSQKKQSSGTKRRGRPKGSKNKVRKKK